MNLLFRIAGTWLIGLAVIFLILDGTKSLAANMIVTTSLGENWAFLHAQSLLSVREFLADRMFKPVLEPVMTALLGFPAFLVLGVPGLILAFMGRGYRARHYVRQDQI